MSRNTFEQDDYTPCCALCEHSQSCGEGLSLCLLKKKPKETPANGVCRHFVFDLLKYTPAKQNKHTFNEADFPSFD